MRRAVINCIRAASRAYGVPVGKILGRQRTAEIAEPRQAAMLLARWEGHSYERIGRECQRNHVTVWHGCRAAARRAEEDEASGDLLQAAWFELNGVRA